MASPQAFQQLADWWLELARRLGVGDKGQFFFENAIGPDHALERVDRAGADLDYILFILIRHWIPPVLPPPGQERTSKSDPDYWLESEQLLKSAVARLRELKPLIDLLTASDPFKKPQESQTPPVVEVELARMLEGIAEEAGRYGGPDYTSIIKSFDPIPLRQTQPFKHNKKHSAELWVVFLLREHFKALGLGKDRYWPLIADVIAAAGIQQPSGHFYTQEELKSWWTKNWPRTYTLLQEKGTGEQATHDAYQSDYEWFRSWFAWQMSRSAKAPS